MKKSELANEISSLRNDLELLQERVRQQDLNRCCHETKGPFVGYVYAKDIACPGREDQKWAVSRCIHCRAIFEVPEEYDDTTIG